MGRKVHGYLHDEQGDCSQARLAFAFTVPFTFLVIVVDMLTRFTVPGEAYALLAGLLTGLIAWAGGSRIARYLGPQVAGVVQGIAAKVSPGTTTVEVTNTPPGTTLTEPPPEK